MPRSLKCPDDQAPMQPLFLAPARGGSEIEVDRCLKCGALWFDAGELEILAGLDSRDTTAESTRACPVCHDPMADAALSQHSVGQRCDRCHGTYVDGKNVRRLRALSLPRLVQTDKVAAVPARADAAKTVETPAVPRRQMAGFVCAKCGGKFPYAEGNGTNKGLVCRGCVVNPTLDKPSRGGLFASSVDADDVGGGDWDLTDLFD